MPAITVSAMEALTLPRIPVPEPADTERPVRSITTGPRGYEGKASPSSAPSPACRPPSWTRSSTWIRWVRSNTNPANRAGRVGTPSRLRNRHLHDRRKVRPSGLTRRRRAHP